MLVILQTTEIGIRYPFEEFCSVSAWFAYSWFLMKSFSCEIGLGFFMTSLISIIMFVRLQAATSRTRDRAFRGILVWVFMGCAISFYTLFCFFESLIFWHCIYLQRLRVRIRWPYEEFWILQNAIEVNLSKAEIWKVIFSSKNPAMYQCT